MWFHLKSLHRVLCSPQVHRHDFVKKSPQHRQDARPLFVCRTPVNHRPSLTLKIHMPMYNRWIPESSPMHHRIFCKILAIIPRIFIEGYSIHRVCAFSWDHMFDIGIDKFHNSKTSTLSPKQSYLKVGCRTILSDLYDIFVLFSILFITNVFHLQILTPFGSKMRHYQRAIFTGSSKYIFSPE